MRKKSLESYYRRKDKVIQSTRQWQKSHPETVRAIDKRRDEKPKRKADKRANSKRYQLTHKEEIKAYAAQHYEKNRERVKERTRQWEIDHPEQVRLLGRRKEQNRRARKRAAFVEDVDPHIVFERDQGVCQICSLPVGDGYHIDHVIPLAKGGEHSYANVQLSHPACNLHKADK